MAPGRIPCVSENQPLRISETIQKQDQGLRNAAMFTLVPSRGPLLEPEEILAENDWKDGLDLQVVTHRPLLAVTRNAVYAWSQDDDSRTGSAWCTSRLAHRKEFIYIYIYIYLFLCQEQKD